MLSKNTHMAKPIPSLYLLLLGCLMYGAVFAKNETLPRPDSLKPAVAFWTRVYTEIDTQSGFIHDDRNLDVVYETVRFKPGKSRKQRARQVKKAKKRYKEILTYLAKGKRSRLTKEQQRILGLWPKDVSNKELRVAARRLRFQLGQSDKFRQGMVRSGTWVEYIRETMIRYGLPLELAALPHVESSYNPKAYSKVGASGLWQFTRSTGRRFMRIDHVVDERMDPILATEAAAKLLQHNYSVTKSWPLAITAYNHGLSGMRRAKQKLGTDDMGVIVERYKSRVFGFASRNFYVAFLAAVDVSNNAEHYFGKLNTNRPIPQDGVTVPAYVSVNSIAKALKVSKKTLRKYNPALRDNVWSGSKHVPKGYRLKLPASTSSRNQQTALTEISPAERYRRQIPDRYHTVRRGDTLSTIARRYDTNLRKLLELNALNSRHFIRVGQVLRLPIPAGSTVTMAQIPSDGRYTIRMGDTISRISKKFGVSDKVLAQSNGIVNRNRIQVGQVLIIPGTGEVVRVAQADRHDITPSNKSQSVKPILKPKPVKVPTPVKPAAPVVIAATDSISEVSPEQTISDEPTPFIGPPEPIMVAAVSRSLLPQDHRGTPGTQGMLASEDTPQISTQDALEAVVDQPLRRSEDALDNDDSESISQNIALQTDQSHPALEADPSNYTVAENHTIEVQAAETLGHYAEWLGLRTSRLRHINRMRFGKPVVVGHRLRLDFSRITPAQFEQKRVTYHQQLQEQFFQRYHITGSRQHVIKRGDSLWTLSQHTYNVPIWLLRQYNPDLDFASVQPGSKVDIPHLQDQQQINDQQQPTQAMIKKDKNTQG